MSLTIVGVTYLLYRLWFDDMAKEIGINNVSEVLLVIFLTSGIILLGSVSVFLEYLIAVETYSSLFV